MEKFVNRKNGNFNWKFWFFKYLNSINIWFHLAQVFNLFVFANKASSEKMFSLLHSRAKFDGLLTAFLRLLLDLIPALPTWQTQNKEIKLFNLIFGCFPTVHLAFDDVFFSVCNKKLFEQHFIPLPDVPSRSEKDSSFSSFSKGSRNFHDVFLMNLIFNAGCQVWLCNKN